MNSMYPQVIQEVEAYLKTCTFDVPRNINNVIDIEEISDPVVDVILGRFDGKKAPSGCWYNLKLNNNSNDVYCIVQVITSNTIKIHQKEAFVHSFTCIDVNDIDNDMSFNDMHECIEDNMLDDRDYSKECYFIFIDANDCTVMIKSVCDVVFYQLNQGIVDNPCDFIQIDWEKEKNFKTLHHYNISEIKVRIFRVIAETLRYLLCSSADFMNKYSV
jgi:hypothetical protein